MHTGKFCRLQPFPSGLLSLSPASCATQGVICDLTTAADATIFTYTGHGLQYNGVPLVQTPGSRTLVLSSDPACQAPDGDSFSFPLVALQRECLDNFGGNSIDSACRELEATALPQQTHAKRVSTARVNW